MSWRRIGRGCLLRIACQISTPRIPWVLPLVGFDPAEALLRLLRMKRHLLGLRPFDQFLDPIEHSLIGVSGRHSLVMLDLAVEFDALLTHCGVFHTEPTHR
jgi:hypothetical protein